MHLVSDVHQADFAQVGSHEQWCGLGVHRSPGADQPRKTSWKARGEAAISAGSGAPGVRTGPAHTWRRQAGGGRKWTRVTGSGLGREKAVIGRLERPRSEDVPPTAECRYPGRAPGS